MSSLSGPGSVVGIMTGYGLDGPGIESRWRARFSAPVQNGPGAHPASCTVGTKSFPGVNSGRGITLTPHPLLVPWSWKGRAIPLLPLWAVRTVQSLSACTRVHFTLPFLYNVKLMWKWYWVYGWYTGEDLTWVNWLDSCWNQHPPYRLLLLCAQYWPGTPSAEWGRSNGIGSSVWEQILFCKNRCLWSEAVLNWGTGTALVL